MIRLDRHQEAAFWSELRTLFLLWRRQAGKSFTLGAWSFYRMGMLPDHLVILCSASIALGKEFVRKEAQVWRIFTQAYRELLLRRGDDPARLTTSADNDSGQLLDLDAISDLFQHQKLETRFYHSRTTYSRSVVAAPNPDTAVGWTGDVCLDEIGRIECLRELLEALGPIMTRNPLFRMRMATTISPDDTHYSREIHGVRPEQPDFIPAAAGTLYQSKSGYSIHRFDAYDAEIAAAAGAEGLKLYDDKTGAEITPERAPCAAALDKDAEDRNYFLKETTGVYCRHRRRRPHAFHDAGAKGQCVAEEHHHQRGDRRHPAPSCPRLDHAHATRPYRPTPGSRLRHRHHHEEEEQPLEHHPHAAKGPPVPRPAHRTLQDGRPRFRPGAHRPPALHAPPRPQGPRPQRTSTPATSASTPLRRRSLFPAGASPVHPIVSGETLDYRGGTITYKSLLGNELINTANDGYLALPPKDWIEKDWRLVKLDEGRFYADVDESGNHADTFDSTKLAK